MSMTVQPQPDRPDLHHQSMREAAVRDKGAVRTGEQNAPLHDKTKRN